MIFSAISKDPSITEYRNRVHSSAALVIVVQSKGCPAHMFKCIPVGRDRYQTVLKITEQNSSAPKASFDINIDKF